MQVPMQVCKDRKKSCTTLVGVLTRCKYAGLCRAGFLHAKAVRSRASIATIILVQSLCSLCAVFVQSYLSSAPGALGTHSHAVFFGSCVICVYCIES
jgi:hypothetical protein